MESLLDSSLATRSRRTYTRVWQVFQSIHMATYGIPAYIPLTLDKTAMFVAHLDSANHTRATIWTYVSTVSHSHKLADVDDPTTRFWVRKLIKAAGSGSQCRAARRPITLEILRKITHMAQLSLPSYDASLMRAVFSLCFHECARIVEMVCSNGLATNAILTQNVAIRRREMSITFSFFKHHKGSTPVTRTFQGATSDVCPAQLLRAYALVRPGHWRAPLFVWSNGAQVDAKKVKLCLQSCLLGAGEASAELSPHSFRIGAVSELAEKGASESHLQMMGKWKSNVYMKYLRQTHHMPGPR